MAIRIAVTTLLVLLAATLAQAGNDWWEDIHCSGAQFHSEGTAPPQEPTLDGTQCHGQPGDDGSCGSSSTAGDYSVTCSSVTLQNPTSELCLASITCHSPTGDYTISCGGSNYAAFAGLTSGIDGSVRAFLYCKKGGSEEYNYCGTAT